MSASRAGSTASGASRARTSAFQFLMGLFTLRSLRAAQPRDAVQCREERAPAPPLRGEHRLSFRGEAIETFAALTALLDPPALNETAALEAVERGVERGDVKLQGAAGSAVDQLRQLVAVAIALVEEREQQNF